MRYNMIKLCEVVDIDTGFAFKSEKFNTNGRGYRLVRGMNVTKGNIRWGKDTFWWDEDLELYSKYYLSENDIVIGMDGSLVGKNYAKVKKEDLPALLVQRVARIKAKKGVDQEFIYNLIANPYFVAYVDKIKTGTSIPHISLSQIKNYEIPDFPESEQKRIGYILGLINTKIDLNTKTNDNLAELMNVMFQEWFDNHGEMEQKPLYELADYINGTSFKPDEYVNEGIPIIKIAELKNGITQTTQYFSGEKDEKYYIKNGDILFSWSGNPETSIDTFIWHDGNGILNQHTFKVIPKENEEVYVYLMLKSFKPIFTAIASNKQTTGLGHVTVADLKRLTFYYDGIKVKEFNEFVKPIYMKFYNNCIENGKLEIIRDTLLPKLMIGEINLDSLNNEEL